MRLSKSTMLGAVCVAMILQSCSAEENTASDTQFKSVLNAYYAKHKDCVDLPTTNNDKGFFYIAEIADDTNEAGALKNDGNLKPFLALVEAGVMTAQDMQVSVKVFSRTKQVPGKGFKLTSYGKSLLLANEFKRGHDQNEPQLCYGRRVVNEIIKFSEPQDIRGVTASSVQYSFTVGDIADWARFPDVYLRYPHIEIYIAQTSQDTDDLVLGDKGWMHSAVSK